MEDEGAKQALEQVDFAKRPSTPPEIKKYRQSTAHVPGAIVKHFGLADDKPLLDGLMKCAVDLRPELTRDGQGLTELEFVLAMLIELGVVERGMVTPFLAQFRALDVDGTGRLGQADLDMGVSHPGARKATSNDLGSRSLGSARKVVGCGSSKVAPTSGQ